MFQLITCALLGSRFFLLSYGPMRSILSCVTIRSSCLRPRLSFGLSSFLFCGCSCILCKLVGFRLLFGRCWRVGAPMGVLGAGWAWGGRWGWWWGEVCIEEGVVSGWRRLVSARRRGGGVFKSACRAIWGAWRRWLISWKSTSSFEVIYI